MILVCDFPNVPSQPWDYLSRKHNIYKCKMFIKCLKEKTWVLIYMKNSMFPLNIASIFLCNSEWESLWLHINPFHNIIPSIYHLKMTQTFFLNSSWNLWNISAVAVGTICWSLILCHLSLQLLTPFASNSV